MPRATKSKKTKKILVGAAIVGFLGSGTVYAYWTNSGTGTGTAATGTNAPSRSPRPAPSRPWRRESLRRP